MHVWEIEAAVVTRQCLEAFRQCGLLQECTADLFDVVFADSSRVLVTLIDFQYVHDIHIGFICRHALSGIAFPVKRVNKGAPVSFTGMDLRKLLEHLAGSFLRAFVAALGVGFFVFFVQCCRTRGRSRAISMHAGAVLVAPNLVPSTVFLARDVFLLGAVKGRVSITSTVAAGWLDCGAMSCQECVVWLGSRAWKW